MATNHTLPNGWSEKRTMSLSIAGGDTEPTVFEHADGDRRIEIVPTRVEMPEDESEWRVRDVHARTTAVLDSAPDRLTAIEMAVEAMRDEI